MCGQDEVGAAADVQTALQIVASLLQFHGLCHEQVGSDDAAVADDVQFALVEDTRGDAAEDELLALEDDGVSGIWTAGKTCHNVVAWGEYVYNLTFAFVAEDDAQEGINFSFCHSSYDYYCLILCWLFLGGSRMP